MKGKIVFIIVSLLVVVGIAWFSFSAYVWFTKTNFTYQLRPDGKIESINNTNTEDETNEKPIVIDSDDEGSVLPGLLSPIIFEIQKIGSPKDVIILPEEKILLVYDDDLKITKKNGEMVSVLGLPKFTTSGAEGILDLELDSSFSTNGLVFMVYSYRNTNGFIFSRVSSFNLRVVDPPSVPQTGEEENKPAFTQAVPEALLSDEHIILDNIPAGLTNNGGGLIVGKSDFLWLLTGDTGKAILSQDQESLAGKVLRFRKNGSIPEDNPWSGLYLYALGFKNPIGLVESEMGDKFILDSGSASFDEINILSSGGNFGSPVVNECNTNDTRFTNPLVCSGKMGWKPKGLAYIKKDSKEMLLVGSGNTVLGFDLVDGKLANNQKPKILASGYKNLKKIKIVDGILYILVNDSLVAVNP